MPGSAYRKLLLIGILSQWLCYGSSQVLYQGHVADVAGYRSLSNVKIELLESGQLSFSNSAGNFVFLDPGSVPDSANGLSGNFITQGNILVWNFNTSFDLHIVSQSGALHYAARELPPSGYMSLESFRNGLFFMRVSSAKGVAAYKLLSVSHQFYVSAAESREAGHSGEKSLEDTLLFEKEGYYPLKTPVISGQGSIDARMLKRSYDHLDYFNELVATEAFTMVSSVPSKTHMGEVASVKVLYDAEQDLLYYMNSKIHTNHYYFASSILGYRGSLWTFNHTQYVAGPDRYYYPATLNYFSGLDVYTLEFFSGDGASCEEVYRVYNKILGTSFIGDKLFFYATNDSWSGCRDVPVITSNELFEGQNYQALNLAESYGYLRKVDVAAIEDTWLSRHDIVVLNGIPIDIPVVAGIITTEFQTPLSHINVLSHNRGTPNMALRDAWTLPKLDSLFGKLVYLKVESDSFTIRTAGYEEASLFWSLHEPRDTIYLEADTQTQGLVELGSADIDDVKLVGGKAANFAEMIKAFESRSMEAPVPEDNFAIPFYYYAQHLKQYGLDSYIREMLANPVFYADAGYRADYLEVLRDSIIGSPIDEQLMTMIYQRLENSAHFSTFRFRSSTNAEDLEDFNGAGLYASYTGRLNDASSPPEEAIKKVWASLWNFRAFEERDYFKIAHQSCAMGVLVHRSFPDEEANGVAITRNLYNSNPGFIINVQFGEHSIVDPEPGVLHDQIILYLYSISGEEPFTPEYICHSNIPGEDQETVLSKEELFDLGNDLRIIKQYFYDHVYVCNCAYDDFGLDIEFKIDSEREHRKIYIKQVRPY